ncbi:surface protease GP63 [Trypanosoma cruzi]|nr:surface protease GP63 [Trypanosoma cruzi]
MDSCPIIGPALDVRNAAAVIWMGEYLSAVPGDEPSSWCLDTPPTNTTDARDPEDTYLSAVMHAALRCLGMRVRLRVTEEGNARCVPCTDGATIAWATRPYDEGNAICRDHAQVCTISATSGSLLPIVLWVARRGCVEQDGFTGIYWTSFATGIRPRSREHWDRPRHTTEGCGHGCSPEASVARGEGSRLRCHDGNGVRLPSDIAGALQEAEKESDLPDIDYVTADGVTSVVGQSL